MLNLSVGLEDSMELEKKKSGSFKQKALSASAKLKNSIKRRTRRSSSKVMSVAIDDPRDSDEMQAVDAFRQTLILEELLPSRHDDYHMMLRYHILCVYIYLFKIFILLFEQIWA